MLSAHKSPRGLSPEESRPREARPEDSGVYIYIYIYVYIYNCSNSPPHSCGVFSFIFFSFFSFPVVSNRCVSLTVIGSILFLLCFFSFALYSRLALLLYVPAFGLVSVIVFYSCLSFSFILNSFSFSSVRLASFRFCSILSIPAPGHDAQSPHPTSQCRALHPKGRRWCRQKTCHNHCPSKSLNLQAYRDSKIAQLESAGLHSLGYWRPNCTSSMLPAFFQTIDISLHIQFICYK